MILDAARLSLANLFASETRSVFWKVLGLTILVLVGLWFALRGAFMAFLFPWLTGFFPDLPDWRVGSLSCSRSWPVSALR